MSKGAKGDTLEHFIENHPWKLKNCKICNKVFLPSRFGAGLKCCSKECSDINTRILKSKAVIAYRKRNPAYVKKQRELSRNYYRARKYNLDKVASA